MSNYSSAKRVEETEDVGTLGALLNAAGLSAIPQWAWECRIALPNDQRPFQHQVTGLNLIARHVRSALWDEPGTGKTLPVQAYALWLASLGNKVICIMPPVLVQQFYNAFDVFAGVRQHVTIGVFNGEINARNALLTKWEREGYPDILVMTYRMFAGKSVKEKTNLKATGVAASWGWADFAARGYTALVVDEATAIKHPSSGIYKAVKSFVGPHDHRSNGLVLMTGSPIENTPEDAYGYLSVLCPNRYGSFRAFERIHCVLAPGNFRKVIAYTNMDYLYEGMYLYGRRVLQKDVLDLPPTLLTEVPIDLADDHRALYKRLVKERMLELGDKVIDATTASSLRQKMQQILMTPEHFSEKNIKHNAVVDAIDELLRMINPGEHKVLLYAYYQRSIEKLAAHYKSLNPAVLYGGTRDRDGEIAKFKTDDSCRLIISQIRSAGLGLNLQDVCHYEIFSEMVSVPGLFRQACDRTRRAGQRHTVNIYLLVVQGTVSVSLRNDLCRKDGTGNDVVRDAKWTLRDLLGEEGVQGQLV